jgi:hypothetical protein
MRASIGQSRVTENGSPGTQLMTSSESVVKSLIGVGVSTPSNPRVRLLARAKA